jgi:signal transduction histidine kinase
MKRYIYISFIVTVTLLFTLHYIIFQITQDYLNSFLLLIPAILAVSYLFVLSVIEPKQKQDRVLEHLIKELLHEVNLPIATIEANLQMVKRGLSDKNLIRIERIKDALNRLKRLNSLISYNLKREILEIEKESVEVDSVVKDRVEFFNSLKRNPIKLSLKPLEVTTDKIGLEQTIDNIIENSMKYSAPNKPIEISIKGSKLTIKDYGKGISEADIVKIFNRYYQGDISSRGEGIGLNIVKRFCDEERIGLKVFSKLNSGTMVELDFSKLQN